MHIMYSVHVHVSRCFREQWFFWHSSMYLWAWPSIYIVKQGIQICVVHTKQSIIVILKHTKGGVKRGSVGLQETNIIFFGLSATIKQSIRITMLCRQHDFVKLTMITCQIPIQHHVADHVHTYQVSLFRMETPAFWPHLPLEHSSPS